MSPTPTDSPQGVPTEGSLASTPLPRILAALVQSGATGTLDLTQERIRKTIFFQKGRPVNARGNALNEVLGRVLVKMGWITPEQLSASLHEMKQSRRPQGQILVEMGALRPSQLDEALVAQASTRIYNVLSWTEGTFQFTSLPTLPSDVDTYNLNLAQILLQAFAQQYDWARLVPLLAPWLATRPIVSPANRALMADWGLSDSDHALLNELNGSITVNALLEQSPLGQESAGRLLVVLRLCGMLEFESAPPSAIPQTTIPQRPTPPSPPPTPRAPTTAPTSPPVPSGPLIPLAPPLQAQDDEFEFGNLEALLAEAQSRADQPAPDFTPQAPPPAPPPAAPTGFGDDDASHTRPGMGILTTGEPAPPAAPEGMAALSAHQKFTDGVRLLAAGAIERACGVFKEAYELCPKDPEYRAHYGWALWKLNVQHDLDAADAGERLLHSALGLPGNHSKTRYFLGCIARTRDDVGQARSHFEAALRLAPDDPQIQQELNLLDRRDTKNRGITGLFRGKK